MGFAGSFSADSVLSETKLSGLRPEQMDFDCSIRLARPEEAPVLTHLAIRSKAHWGYDASFMKACNSELTVTTDQIAERATFVFEEQAVALAFYRIEIEAETADIASFFVDPFELRRGIGTKMWRHLLDLCRQQGTVRITIASDPNAVDFYQSLGAQPIGTVPSESIAGRSLPLLEYLLEQSA